MIGQHGWFQVNRPLGSWYLVKQVKMTPEHATSNVNGTCRPIDVYTYNNCISRSRCIFRHICLFLRIWFIRTNEKCTTIFVTMALINSLPWLHNQQTQVY